MTSTNETSPAETRTFTPVHRRTGERLRLLIKRQDMPRGRKWSRVVTDLHTGVTYRAWNKGCGLRGCMCDAYVEELPAPEKGPSLRPAWCGCEHAFEDDIYMPDQCCPCGVDKHHYHCHVCKGVSQVG